MSKKHFCDACEDELNPDNTVGRAFEIDHQFQITGHEFSFKITYGSNAAGGRIVQGDGDLCTDCLRAALIEYLKPEAEEDEDDGENDIADAFAENDETEEEET